MDLDMIIRIINWGIAFAFCICFGYQGIYAFVILRKEWRKKNKLQEKQPVTKHDFLVPRKEKDHRFAVLIAARNEEAVIGNLIASINEQNYPKELVDVYVVADNCNDFTAQIARQNGAFCYERFNTEQVGKGYAMEFLFANMKRQSLTGQYDAFLVLDADNLLDRNYIKEMNKTFCKGYDIITSYRNTKNYGDNWISAGYGLWFLREAKYLNEARMLTGNSCAVSGTGFLFSQKVYAESDGWPWHLLTEDIEFTIEHVIDGYKVGYSPDAILYDEQPVKFSQSWNQRLRWVRGYLQVFQKHGNGLFKGVVKERNFSCFDMAMCTLPAFVLTASATVANIILTIIAIMGHQSLTFMMICILRFIVGTCGAVFVMGIITTITEWDRIHATTGQKILYMFTFPFFMLTYIPIAYVALVKKVEWSPIVHERSISLKDLDKKVA